ncbi:MAG: Phage protein [Rhodospirillales bacterium]|jgi:hypothetical protein|nr:Phage protein [Rhodospirillales bacterium]
MSADIDLVNQALSAIGTQSTIQSFTENSTEALHAGIHYATTRDDLLRSYRWGFAKGQIALSLLAAAAGTPENPQGTALPLAPQPWLYAYAYPTDCLDAQRIVPSQQLGGTTIPIFPVSTSPAQMFSGPPVRFAKGQMKDSGGNPIIVILTNQAQALLDYTVATPNMALADTLFTSALVGRLAAKLVNPLSGDKGLAKIAAQDGQISEGIAAARDANENYGDTINRPASWIAARGAVDYEMVDGSDLDMWPPR